MTNPIARDPMYRRRSFDADIIEVCVHWDITYRLSYRDLVAMVAERGVEISHTTILRWVVRYVPEFEKRWNRYTRRIGFLACRPDVRFHPRQMALPISNGGQARQKRRFLLRRDRGIAAAQAFFRKALATNPTRWPRKVTLDGHTPSHRALRLLRRENPKWKYVEVRTCKYLNNIVEQDHCAIKRRDASMKGFKSFTNVAITIAGIELAHRIHERQFSFGLGRPRRNCSSKIRWQRALA